MKNFNNLNDLNNLNNSNNFQTYNHLTNLNHLNNLNKLNTIEEFKKVLFGCKYDFILQGCYGRDDTGYVYKFDGWFHDFRYPWQFSPRDEYRWHRTCCTRWHRNRLHLVSRCSREIRHGTAALCHHVFYHDVRPGRRKCHGAVFNNR